MTAVNSTDKSERPEPDSREWITDLCMASSSTCPDELLEEVMADPRCVAFGPIHH